MIEGTSVNDSTVTDVRPTALNVISETRAWDEAITNLYYQNQLTNYSLLKINQISYISVSMKMDSVIVPCVSNDLPANEAGFFKSILVGSDSFFKIFLIR